MVISYEAIKRYFSEEYKENNKKMQKKRKKKKEKNKRDTKERKKRPCVLSNVLKTLSKSGSVKPICNILYHHYKKN